MALTVIEGVGPGPGGPALPPEKNRSPREHVWFFASLLWRSAVLLVATVIAFHHTLLSIAQQTYNGDPLAYLFLMPFWAVVIVVGTHLYRRNGPLIHDRQIDWIIAIGDAGLIFLIGMMLSPRLGASQELVRVDVLTLFMFLIFGCILLFGSRATSQYWALWAFFFAVFPLPYRLIGAYLGGTPRVFALVNVGYTAIALGVASGGKLRSRVVPMLLALMVGFVVVVVLGSASPIVLQLVPAMFALVITVAVVYGRRRTPIFPQTPNTVGAVKKFPAAIGAILAVAAVLGFVVDFTPPSIVNGTLPQVGTGWISAPLTPPHWSPASKVAYPWVPNYFGLNAIWNRYRFKPDISTPSSEAIVVDALTAPGTGPFTVYPAISCYSLSAPYVQDPNLISLGHGVAATLFYANSAQASSPVNAQWLLVTWVWKVPDTGHGGFQRITVTTLDGVPSKVGIPLAAPPGSNGNIRTTLEDIFRGLASSAAPLPSTDAILRLERFAHQIVSQQSQRAATTGPTRISP